MDAWFIACLVGAIGLVGLAIIASAIRIAQEFERLVVFRLGRCVGERGPGLVFLIPFIERAIRVDLREQIREIPHQTSITKDNANIAVDFIWYYKVVDAMMSTIQVGNFEKAAEGMATTTLRWGVKVTNVEIREIIPPDEIQEAMTRQMTAERVRRAVVTESTGQREAAVNIADGEKQAAILIADGDKQANILRAEGDREAQLLRAEGYSAALQRIFGVAKKIDQKTMTLQYFETLKDMGASPATKFIFPMEFTSLLENFTKGSK
jgi:regulator of protease activity HflC (stomatin/prohibitin superfamily)